LYYTVPPHVQNITIKSDWYLLDPTDAYLLPPYYAHQYRLYNGYTSPLLGESFLGNTELREVTSPVNRVLYDSNIDYPVHLYVERREEALKKSKSEVLLLRRENTECEELLWIRRQLMKSRFGFDMIEILGVAKRPKWNRRGRSEVVGVLKSTKVPCSMKR
jgi:hypothetical protein